MAEQEPPIERLEAMVQESAKYRHVCPDLIRRLGERELTKRRSLKEAVKETKNTLHQVAGAYLERTPRYAHWIAELRRAPDGMARKEISRAILAEHASTCERLPYLETFYQTALAEIGPVRSVLDIACGLNPLTLPWMPLAREGEMRYSAYDIYADMMTFLNEFLLVSDIVGHAQVADVAMAAPQDEAEIALILKFLPVLEQTERGTAQRWLRSLRARYLLVSFPTRSLGGHGRGRAEHYEGWFRELLQAENWSAQRFLFPNELCFLVEKEERETLIPTMKVFDALQPTTDKIRRDPVCLILANPKAGRLAIREYLAGMTERFTTVRTYPTPPERVPTSLALLSAVAGEIGLRADVELSPPPDGMAERIRAAEAQGYDTIVAVGGDGTVHHVVQHLVGTSLRLGILPLGTANNFARGLNIPGDLEGAMRTLARGQERVIDVGRIKNEYFIEAVGVGLFADSLLAMGGQEVHRHEISRIFRVTMPLLWNPRARRLNLTLDGRTEEEEVILVTVSNSRYLGENWPMAPDASLEDGLFDVVTVGAMSRWELMRFIPALMRGTHLRLPNVQIRRASRVEIRRVHRVNHPLPVHADDHILAYLPVSMEVFPRALRVLAPLPLKSEGV